jgi:PadR family transcriptional regulator, regulatory protein PadR
MPDKTIDLLQGTLDLLILKALALGPMHGFGVSVRLQQLSRDALQVQQGSLYPALHRLEHQGWITSDWGISENNRKAKFYSLTKAGSVQLDEERENWRKLSAAIGLVLGANEV